MGGDSAMTAGLLESFLGRYPFRLDDVPAAGDPGHPRRAVRHRLGAHRRGQDAGRRVRHPPRARAGPPPRLHHAAQGALQPEVRRLRPPVGRGPGRHPHRRRQGQPARAGRRHDHRDPSQHVLHRRARGARDGRARRVPLHGRRGARDGVGGDHRQLPARRRPGRPVRHRQERGGDRGLDQRGAPAHRGDHAPAPAGAAPVPRGRPVGRGPSVGRGARRARAPARRGAGPAPGPARALVLARRGRPDRHAGRARRARLAARHLLHLQPRGLRARDGDGAGRGQAAPAAPAAARGAGGDPRGHRARTRRWPSRR